MTKQKTYMNDFATDRDLLNLNYLSNDCTKCTKSNLQLAQKAQSLKLGTHYARFFVPDVPQVMMGRVLKSVHGSKNAQKCQR